MELIRPEQISYSREDFQDLTGFVDDIEEDDIKEDDFEEDGIEEDNIEEDDFESINFCSGKRRTKKVQGGNPIQFQDIHSGKINQFLFRENPIQYHYQLRIAFNSH